MKKLFILGTLILGVCAFADEIIYNGGKIIPLELKVIETAPYDLNFCFATKYNDTIHLTHSKGVHTISERHCADISYDNGQTWQKPEKGVHVAGMNAALNSKGEIIQIGIWDAKAKTQHNLVWDKITPDGQRVHLNKTIDLPYATSAHTHRDILVTRDGRMIATAYGKKVNANRSHIFAIESKDDGETWNFLSIITEPEAGDQEGANETTLVQLKDGTILAIYRVDGMKSCKQRRSTDGGKTWSASERVGSMGGASPHAIVLENGTLALVTGRPNLYLYLDFTGTGKKYQQHTVWKGGTSSYASLIETAPNELMVVYDESRFMSTKSNSDFARIMAAKYSIVKDDSLSTISGDPKAQGFDVWYSAWDKKDPMEAKFGILMDYKKDKNVSSHVYVHEIPERPYPVLRMQSHGTVADGKEWARIDINKMPEGVAKADVEFEFRLMDNSDKPQFMVSVYFTPQEGKNLSAYVAFAKDYIQYLQDGNLRKVPFDFGVFKFRNFVMKCDTTKNVWELYEKGGTKPLLKLPFINSPKTSHVAIGDGGRNIFGTIDLSYIGWKYKN
ncbi:MAG: exo-alpha-sialidase [Lentisphaeria bacterium]|nr:exo-alpha-sialidase [Lentisphaeria bacterium]